MKGTKHDPPPCGGGDGPWRPWKAGWTGWEHSMKPQGRERGAAVAGEPLDWGGGWVVGVLWSGERELAKAPAGSRA